VYLDGVQNDRALELFNPTCGEIGLDEYEIWVIPNGGSQADASTRRIVLGGGITAGSSLLICHTGFDGSNYGGVECDMRSEDLDFNGDDAVLVVRQGSAVDVIGIEGSDPGLGWSVAGVGAATRNHMLVRKADVLRGSTDWATSEARAWEVLDSSQSQTEVFGSRVALSDCGWFDIAVYACLCEAGYSGHNCDHDDNECASSPCENGGSCMDSLSNSSVALGQFSCDCAVGWFGSVCSAQTAECGSDPCVNGGMCVDSVGTYSCVCHVGFEGHDCEFDSDECTSSPCLNLGLCQESSTVADVGVDVYQCLCSAGWYGENCALDYDECSSNPCQNSGACYESSRPLIAYTSFEEPTIAEAGVASIYFDTEMITPGAIHLLTNHDGENIVQYTGYNALNRSLELGFQTVWQAIGSGLGFAGGNSIGVIGDDTTHMQGSGSGKAPHGQNVFMLTDTDGFGYVKIDVVDLASVVTATMSAWVHVEATSWEDDDSIKIWAVSGDGSETILLSSSDIDSLAEDSWMQLEADVSGIPQLSMKFGLQADSVYEEVWYDYFKITASVATDDYTCRCTPGWAGSDRCINIDECASNPCENSGGCRETEVDAYVCACTTGWEGENCALDMNECGATDPCVNGANCTESSSNTTVLIGDFHCACAKGWEGTNCGRDADECTSSPCEEIETCIDSSDNEVMELEIPLDAYECIPALPVPPMVTDLHASTVTSWAGSQFEFRGSAQALEWTGVVADTLVGYKLYMDRSDGWQLETLVVAGDTRQPLNFSVTDTLPRSLAYNVEIAATSPAGDGVRSSPLRVYTAPAVVFAQLDSETRATTTSIYLTWNAPTVHTEAPISAYHILAISSDGNQLDVIGTVESNVLNFTANGMSGGERYHFAVAGENRGGLSTVSLDNVLSADTAPLQPVPSWLNSTTSTSRISWVEIGNPEEYTEPTAPLLGYHVYISEDGREFEEIHETDPSEPKDVTIYNLIGSRQYFFRVSAENSAGEGDQSSVATGYTATVKPDEIFSSSPSDYANTSAISLSWTPVEYHPNAPVLAVRIWQDDALVATWSPDSGTERVITLSELAVGSKYLYSISTLNVAGESDRSDPVALYTVPKVPTAVQTIRSGALYANETAVAIGWEAAEAADPIAEYRIYTREAASPDRDEAASPPYELSAVVTAPATTGSALHLHGGRRYEIKVSAWNNAGESGMLLESLEVFTAPDATIPERGAESSSSVIYTSWQPIVAHELRPTTVLSLHWQRLNTPTGCACGADCNYCAGSETVVQLGLDALSMTIPELEPSALYGVALRAENAAGAEMTPRSVIGTAPPKMEPIVVSMIASTYVMISWTSLPLNVAQAAGVEVLTYRMHAVDTEEGTTQVSISRYGSVMQVLAGLQPQRAYSISIAAQNSFGTADFSNAILVETT
jgi:hypothetical protein